jgi:hypothetical protein
VNLHSKSLFVTPPICLYKIPGTSDGAPRAPKEKKKGAIGRRTVFYTKNANTGSNVRSMPKNRVPGVKITQLLRQNRPHENGKMRKSKKYDTLRHLKYKNFASVGYKY